MSSNAASSLCTVAIGTSLTIAGLLWTAPLGAQDDTSVTPPAETEATEEETAAEPAERPAPINILITVPRGEVNEAQFQRCEDNADAATISGEIVVCRRRGENGENYFSGSRSEAQKRYARETAFQGDPQAPDVAGGGIFRGPATISGQCLIPPCPPPPALLIDVEALPEAPAGSDADRIARGLPPLGQDENLTEEEIRKRREALGLPPPKYEQKPE
ncbi:MAG: hypothetical protein AAFQ27_04015 [Pseudomonadota bacterium]